MTASSPSEHGRVEVPSSPSLPSTLPSTLAPPRLSPSPLTSTSSPLVPATSTDHLDPTSPLPFPLGESVLLNGEACPSTTITPSDSPLSENHLIAPATTAMTSLDTTLDNGNTLHSSTQPDAITPVPRIETSDISDTIPHTNDIQDSPALSNQREEESLERRHSEEEPSVHGLDSTASKLTVAAPLADYLSFFSQDNQDNEQGRPSSLVQLLSASIQPLEETVTTPSIAMDTSSEATTTTEAGATTTTGQPLTTSPRVRDIPPPLSLPLPRFSSQAPMFTSADEPPPYSPTHTILPHYFELEPIPVRTYIIKDSTGFPFLYDFWLISTTAQASSSRPQSVLLQERGISPQHQAELKYSIIRPQHTDRTALPITGPGATNAYFVPALALVADNYPSRWIWWGTEALQMVVFGRQLKNIIMEWRWKHGRTRFGGPIVHRLVGCSFQIAPDRRYCWKAGSGKLRSTSAQQARNRLRQQQQRTRASGIGRDNLLNASASNNDGASSTTSTQQTGRAAEVTGGNGWFGGLFGRIRRPSRPNTEPAEPTTTGITLDSVHVHTLSSESPIESTIQDNPPLSAQESAIDSANDANAEDEDDDDDEAGCYHCREESSTAFLGRIVAVYKPGRPANRARDRAASSRKLEIFTEVGERCETAMMLMCTRLDDLFMSIPATKRGSLVTSRAEVSNRSSSGDGTAGGQQQQQQTSTAGTDGNPHGETGQGTGGDGLGLGGQGGNNNDQEGHPSSLSPSSLVSFTKRLIGTRRDWLFRLKWIIAAILIAVVLVLVLKPKH